MKLIDRNELEARLSALEGEDDLTLEDVYDIIEDIDYIEARKTKDGSLVGRLVEA